MFSRHFSCKSQISPKMEKLPTFLGPSSNVWLPSLGIFFFSKHLTGVCLVVTCTRCFLLHCPGSTLVLPHHYRLVWQPLFTMGPLLVKTLSDTSCSYPWLWGHVSLQSCPLSPDILGQAYKRILSCSSLRGDTSNVHFWAIVHLTYTYYFSLLMKKSHGTY